MALIHVVGIGLDGASGLTTKTRKLVEQATLLVGSNRHLSYFPEHSASRLALGDLQLAIKRIRDSLKTEELIVVLASGDPLFFGLGRLLLANFTQENIYFYPHLSSIQLAFNRLKLPWQDAKNVSVHGRSLEEFTLTLQRGENKIALLTDAQNTPSAIAQHYLALDLPTSYDFWVCENLGGEAEKVSQFTPQELLETTFSPLNVVVLLRQMAEQKILDLESLPLLGLPDSTFISFSDRPGLMTKKEVRVAILGELALQNKQVVWDLGSGTGSVAIEIARCCPSSQVYAVEKTAIGVSLIQQNCQRLQIQNLEIVHAQAPNKLEQLPKPNRIFIGGSGGKLTAILDVCAQQIAVDGLVVLALATVENQQVALQWLRHHHWQYRLLQLQISRSVPIAGLTRFAPLNPVTIVTASRE